MLMTGELIQDRKVERTRNKKASELLTKPIAAEQMLTAVALGRDRRKPAASQTAQLSLLAKPMLHGMAEGLENAMTKLKMLQRTFDTTKVDAAAPRLDRVISDLFRLTGLTEDYYSLFLHLDQEGEIPTGRYDLHADTIDAVLNELAEEIARKKISVKLKRNKQSAYCPRPVQANRVLLGSAFRTLFANAIRYCCDNGTISYGFLPSEESHLIHISYEGPPPADLTELPERLPDKTESGTGYGNSSEAFGLSAAHSVLSHFGGSLICKEGRNCTHFLVALPLSAKERNSLASAAG